MKPLTAVAHFLLLLNGTHRAGAKTGRMLAIYPGGNENPPQKNPDLSCVHCGNCVVILHRNDRRLFHLAEKPSGRAAAEGSRRLGITDSCCGSVRFAGRFPQPPPLVTLEPKAIFKGQDRSWDTTSN